MVAWAREVTEIEYQNIHNILHETLEYNPLIFLRGGFQANRLRS
jgi:hypothetical protein